MPLLGRGQPAGQHRRGILGIGYLRIRLIPWGQPKRLPQAARPLQLRTAMEGAGKLLEEATRHVVPGERCRQQLEGSTGRSGRIIPTPANTLVVGFR